MGNWTIVVPEAGTNLCTNPSFEVDTTGWTAAWGDTLSVVSLISMFGTKSLRITEAASAHWGAYHDATVAASSPCSVSIWVYMATNWDGNNPVLQVYDGAGFSTLLGTSSAITERGQWVKRTIENVTPATTTLRVILYADTAPTVGRNGWLDGVLVQQSTYITSYIDGDQTGCYWNGLFHASTSTRDAQYRLSGHEVDLESTYGVKVLTSPGIGMPPLQNNLQNLALQPGAVFQSYKFLPRAITLLTSTQLITGDALAVLHTRRNNLINLLSPDQYRGSQPIRIGYTGANSANTIYGEYRYESGLEFGDLEARNEKIAIRLLATNPLLYEQTQEVATLDFQDSLASNNYAAARINGHWQNLGTGFNSTVRAIAIDKAHGRVYFGGAFTTANGVTVNAICYWNGTTFVAMDSGVNNIVHAVAIAPNGDVWIGGEFTTVGGAATATKGLARWNYSASTWTAFNQSTSTFFAIESISIASDGSGNVFIGGDFTNWSGNANQDYIVRYNPAAATWNDLGTGANGVVYAIRAVSSTRIYIGGALTTLNGVTITRIGYWNGTTAVAMSGGADATVRTIINMPNGDIIVGGSFATTPTTSYIARWNGAAWSSLGTGLNDECYSLANDSQGNLVVSGFFTTAGGLAASRIAYWNGYTWTHLDFDPFSTPIVYALAFDVNDILYVGGGFSGTATIAGATTVTPSSSAKTYPIITITGPTTANTTCTLKWIENQSSGQRLYFNLIISAGETIMIDFSPGVKTITSSWSGRLYGHPLSNSDFANFHLLPGANTIATFVSGTITGVVCLMIWHPVYLSVDGVA